MVAPVNTVLPAITGTVSIGNTLTVSDGTWTASSPTYAYAWLRDGVVISGATANTHVITLADVGTVLVGRVTATDAGGSTAASSAGTIAVPTTLVVETGARVVGANSYIDRATAATYHAGLGNTAWAALSAGDQEAALKKACVYMEEMYRLRWAGYRYTTTQVLSWPRANVPIEDGPWWNFVAIDTVPQQVIDAQCILALSASTADLAPDLTQQVLSKTVGPISVTYDHSSPEYKRFRAVDMLLRIFLKGTSMNAQLVRA